MEEARFRIPVQEGYLRVRFRIMDHVHLKVLSTRMNGLFALSMIQAARSSLKVLQRDGSQRSERERRSVADKASLHGNDGVHSLARKSHAGCF